MANIGNNLSMERNLELSKQLREKGKWLFSDVYCKDEKAFNEFKENLIKAFNDSKNLLIQSMPYFEGEGYYDMNICMHGLLVLVAGEGKLQSDIMLSAKEIGEMK